MDSGDSEKTDKYDDCVVGKREIGTASDRPVLLNVKIKKLHVTLC
jgi:hypothetical protein